MKFVKNRKELADKYFMGFECYSAGNLGIVSLLSDVQDAMAYEEYDFEYLNEVLNDVKSVLVNEGSK